MLQPLHPPPRFSLLGPLEIEIDGHTVVLTGRQRALCTVLLLHADRVVSVERVIRYLWGEQPPSAGAARVRALVAEVRRAFGSLGTHLLATQSPGYVLRTTPGHLDLLTFEALIRDGSRAVAGGDWTRAYDYHDRALSLWRGDPLTDLPAVEAERQRLSELRIAAREGKAVAEIALGRHGDAIAELVRITARHPLRERPHALLMRALQQDGRTAEALEVYASLRKRMVDELGVDPSDEIRSLHQRLLNGGTDGGPAVQADRPRDFRVPRQLPPAPRNFVGRDSEMRLLDLCCGNLEPLALVVGPAGVGKTALALRWAHGVVRHFPDGQLFLDMRGFDNAEPMTPEEALPLLLQGLGCGPRDIPMGLDAQTALYRTVLADRRVLVVLDDVADASCVRRLLPASRGSLTLVTSRQKLSGLVTLDGAFRVACDVLGEDEALELVRAVIGPEVVADDPDSASKLVELCDRLPLALRVAGSWISDRRPDGIRSYVRDLEERGRLVRLHVEGEERVAVRAALDMSYDTLPDEAKHAFRTLGLMPGTGRSVCAAAAAAGLDASHLADLLRFAQRVHLLRDIESGRLAWHDLVHEYARDRLLVEENVAERASAIERLLDHYLYSIVNLARTCGLYVLPALAEAVDGSIPREFGAPEEAYAWFDGEWDDIAAAIVHSAEHGPTRYAWQLVDALQDLFHHRRPLADWVRLATLAREAAESAGDEIGQAAMCCAIGHARWRDGDLRGALREYESGAVRARRAGWLYGEARNLQGEGVTLKVLGEGHKALPCYRQAISVYRSLGDSRGEAVMLSNLGSLNIVLGQLGEAEDALTSALAMTGEAEDHVHAMALVNLALVRQKQARFHDAASLLRKSFIVSREAGSIYAEAVTLETLGRVHSDAGHDEQAIFVYEDALSVARRSENRNCQVDALVGLASLALRLRRLTEAIEYLDAAHEVVDQTGHRAGIVDLLLERAAVSCVLGQHHEAIEHLERSAGLAKSGNPLMLPRIRTVEALALMEIGEVSRALESARQAVEMARGSGQRLELARGLTVAAEVCEATGELAAARAGRHEAGALFTEIGIARRYRYAVPWTTPPEVFEVSRLQRRRDRRLPMESEARTDLYLADHFQGLIQDIDQ
ncbi:AfsR/SARP family transcriptional regulator [Streptomyces europaeiscabiei]|uniref:AfsR/SARP family transcriptional regulator n=1 Tax=Streptomyces europaeiscabiei TaxID=146819 RepID=UPI002E11356C|nr:tetratricopeptide repeat protein [Streptomyces europaeiscabiei]